jgi:hypothetical protein
MDFHTLIHLTSYTSFSYLQLMPSLYEKIKLNTVLRESDKERKKE